MDKYYPLPQGCENWTYGRCPGWRERLERKNKEIKKGKIMCSLIKQQFKKYIKTILYTVISLQLSFMPYYAYPASAQNGSDGPSNLESRLKELREADTLDNPETFERRKRILELGSAIEEDKVAEFLQKHPTARKDSDHFSLGGQRVESIEYHVEPETNEIVQKTAGVVQLNNYDSQLVPVVFKEIRVHYNAQDQELIFSGISEGQVRLRQYIPDLDIVDYIHDKEQLIILDRKKGLLVVDMFFAKAYLGLAPVPITRISIPILKKIEDKGINITSITLEFVNRSVSPPDVIMPDKMKQIESNFKNESLFQAGDFMISYVDESEQKHLLQFLKRAEIAGWMKLSYDILDVMTKVVAPQLMQKESLALFTKEIRGLTKKNSTDVLDHILSALFTKNALHKLTQAADGMKQRVEQLEKPLSERDAFLFREWNESFEKVKVSGRLPDRSAERKAAGEVLTTNEIADLLNNGGKLDRESEADKRIRAKALRIMANIVSPRNIGNFINKHKVLTAVVGGGGLGGFLFPEKYILLVDKLLPIINSFSYIEQLSFYTFTSIPNLVTLLAVLPGVVMLMSLVSVPFIKAMASIAPESISIMGKVRHPKGKIQDVLANWKKTNVSQRIVGVGMKFVAYAIYPFWNYLAGMVGQPHFFSAIQKGLNPFKKIHLGSDIGELAGIKKSTRLGTQGIAPHWRSNSLGFKQQRAVQDVAQAKEQRMHSVAWLLASLAVAGNTQVNPAEILIYGSAINLDDLKRVHNDKALRSEMFWVMKHLLKEIKQLDEMDIRKELAELDVTMVLNYYEKAMKLAEEVRAQPEFRKKVRRFLNTDKILSLRRAMSLQNITGINRAQHEMLKNVPTDFVTSRIITEFATDHFIVSLLPLLLTNRADVSLEHLVEMALAGSGGSMGWSSSPHINEVVLNLIAHFFISGAQRTMTFTKPTKAIEAIHTAQAEAYIPLESTIKLKTNSQSATAYFLKQISYLISGGKPDNLGGIMWKSYIARFRSMQMTIALFVGLRVLLGAQSASDALAGFLLYHFAAVWVFGWPWDVISGGARLNEHTLAKNRALMEKLQLKLSDVVREIYKEEPLLNKAYEEAVSEMVQLYSSSSALRRFFKERIKTVSPQLYSYMTNINRSKPEAELPVPVSTEEMQKISKALKDILEERSPLPNEKNKTGNIIYTMGFGALLTTYLFVELSIWTFNKEYLTMQNIGMWALINYLGLGALYYIYKKGLTDHVQSAKRWSNYFYGKVLGVKKSVGSSCRKIFSKKTGS